MSPRGCALLLIALAACGGGEMDAKTCATSAAALTAYLRAMDHEPSLRRSSSTLVVRDDLPPAEPSAAPMLVIAASGVGFQGQMLDAADEEELSARLTATLRKAQEEAELGLRRGRAEPDRLLVAIDASVPWTRVEAALGTAARSGMTRFDLAFARTPKPQQPPPPSKIDRELDAIVESEGSDKVTRLAAVAQRVVSRCGPLAREFGSVVESEGSKADQLIGAIGPALVECRCKADLPSIQALFYRVLYNPNPTTWLTLAIGAGEPLSAPPDATWRDVAPRLTQGAPLVLRPRSP